MRLGTNGVEPCLSKHVRSLLVLAGLGLCGGCTPVPDAPPLFSFAELRDHPERYAGQEVVLEGYIDLCWEGGWVSETESDWRPPPRPRDIQVQPSTRIDADSYDGTFGRVYGFVLSDREPWQPILGVTQVLPFWRFRERSEPLESTRATLESMELHPELRLLLPTAPSVGPPLSSGK